MWPSRTWRTGRAPPAAPSSKEPIHLLHRGPQGVAGWRLVGNEPIVLIADFVAGLKDHGDALGLDDGVLAVAGDDEPVPLGAREQTGPARIVGRGIRAPEQLGEQGRDDVVVGRPASDLRGRAS